MALAHDRILHLDIVWGGILLNQNDDKKKLQKKDDFTSTTAMPAMQHQLEPHIRIFLQDGIGGHRRQKRPMPTAKKQRKTTSRVIFV